MKIKNYTDVLIEDYLHEAAEQTKKYFVICTMYNDIVAYGPIKSFDAEDAMCDFFDGTDIAYNGEYEDAYGEFDWDGLTRYVWEVSENEVLPKTDREAKAWIDNKVDESTLVEDRAAEAPAKSNRSKKSTKDKSLLEYTNLQGWQDEIDQIRTKEDADRIPQWVLDQLGITRASITPRTSSSRKPVNAPADKEAAGKFWGNAAKKVIDIANFHKAFDDSLKNMQFDMRAFNSDGLLVNQGTYGKIKSLDPNNTATKAIKRLWGLQFKEQGKILTQVASTGNAVDEPKFIKEVEKLIFEAMPNIDSKAARDLIKQRNNATGDKIIYSFKFDSTGKVVWLWYDDNSDWPYGYTLSTDLGYNPFTKSETEVAADIMTAVENNEIEKQMK